MSTLSPKPNHYIALLRGVNVSGHRKIPMAELRVLCIALGWHDVQSYIQSGNLLFTADASPATLETALEAAIAQQFGFEVPVIIRETAVWPAYVQGNPFPEASETEANLVQMTLSKHPPHDGAAVLLQERAAHGEQIVQVGDALWIYYQAGVAKSKLSTALMDRLVGSAVTARNWRTVLKLAELAGVA